MKAFDKLSERQRNILRFIDKYTSTNGFPPTIRQIGEATGINSTSVVNYNLNKLVKAEYLERAGRVSRGLRLIKDLPGRKKKSVKSVSFPSQVALVGTIAASEPVIIPEDAGHYPDDMIEVPPAMLGGLDPEQVFALKVTGDSMIDAMIAEDDIVIMHQQSNYKNGDMVAVWLDERNETTLKYFYDEGQRVRLQPAHPSMDPIYVDPEHCHIQGRVLSVMRQV